MLLQDREGGGCPFPHLRVFECFGVSLILAVFGGLPVNSSGMEIPAVDANLLTSRLALVAHVVS